MATKKLDRAAVLMLREEFEKELKRIEANLGYRIKVGNGTFDPFSVTFKVELCVVAEDGTTMTEEAEDFKAYAELYGLNPDDLGKIVRVNGRQCKIVGLNLKSHRLPIFVEEIGTGKGYKLTAEAVRSRLAETV